MIYRKEIDGLRALAVIPVILFHAGFTIFKGGFIGVDIFFVISGYLITRIIAEEKESNTFSLATFYKRRARRILPALLAVLLVSIPFSWLWMPPGQQLLFSQNLIAIITFISNVFLWRSSGYFAPSAHENPLLHTWSLSLEEQYYFVFPLLLLALWKLGRRWLIGAVIVALLGSLAVAEYASYRAPGGAFYLFPSRAWELLAGSLLALLSTRRTFSENNALSVVGLGCILAAYALFDETDRWPSLFSALPILGTVLVIAFTGPKTYAYRLLAARPVVFIGLISYSAYLWHQPIFAFARLRAIEPPSPSVMSGLIVLSLGLAWLSWKYIEAPFRRQSTKLSGRKQIALCAACCTAIVSFGLAGHSTGGFPSRFTVPASVYESMHRSDREEECFGFRDIETANPWKCSLGVQKPKDDFFLLGDSHGLSMLYAFGKVAQAENLAGEFTGMSGCTPLLGIYALRPDQGEHNCHALNEKTFEYVKEQQIKTLYIVARWTGYTDNVFAGGTSYIGATPGDSKNLETSRAAFQLGLAETIRRYRDIGTKVVAIRQVPHQPQQPIDVYLRLSQHDNSQDYIDNKSTSVQMHDTVQSFVDAALVDAQQKNPDTFFYRDVAQALCGAKACPIGTPTTSYYLDDHHIGKDGAEKIIPALAAAMKEIQ